MARWREAASIRALYSRASYQLCRCGYREGRRGATLVNRRLRARASNAVAAKRWHRPRDLLLLKRPVCRRASRVPKLVRHRDPGSSLRACLCRDHVLISTRARQTKVFPPRLPDVGALRRSPGVRRRPQARHYPPRPLPVQRPQPPLPRWHLASRRWSPSAARDSLRAGSRNN